MNVEDKNTIEQKVETPFKDSIFSQMDSLRKEAGISIQETFKVDQEDLKYFFEMPFDIGASLTGCGNLKLSEKESNQLSRLWKTPLERLAKKYPAIQDLDIYLACTATLGVIAEKGLAYRIYKQFDNNNSRNERQRQDELLKKTS